MAEDVPAALQGMVCPDGSLFCQSPYLNWRPGAFDQTVALDGDFDAATLWAIAAWMETHVARKDSDG